MSPSFGQVHPHIQLAFSSFRQVHPHMPSVFSSFRQVHPHIPPVFSSFRQVHPHKRLIKRPCPAIPSCRHRWLGRWLPPHDTGQSPATKIYTIYLTTHATHHIPSGHESPTRLVYNAHITGLHPTPLTPVQLVSWLSMHITTLHTHTVSGSFTHQHTTLTYSQNKHKEYRMPCLFWLREDELYSQGRNRLKEQKRWTVHTGLKELCPQD